MFGSWSDHLAAWTCQTRPNTLLLRYEDLANDPHDALRLISAFIDRPIIAERPPRYADLQSVNPKFFRSGVDVRNISELKDESLDLFWLLHGKSMIELGYADRLPSHTELTDLGVVIKRRLVGARAKLTALEASDGHLRADLAATECTLHEIERRLTETDSRLAESERCRCDQDIKMANLERSRWWRLGKTLRMTPVQ